MPRTGRRAGPTITQAAILAAAQQRFAEAGYDGTSIRAVAAAAGVDPGVVLHFFGTKDGLFRAAVGWPVDPALLAARIADPGPQGLVARLARTFLDVWEDPALRAPLLTLLRSSMTHAESATLLREFVVHQLFGRLAGYLEGPDVALRMDLAAAQLLGMAVLRYILGVEPLASAGTDELVAWLTPALTSYLAPGPPDPGERDANQRSA